MARRWINTRVVSEWCEEQQRYVTVEREGYWYDGPVALATHNNPTLVQTNFVGFNDDGSLTTATTKAANNTNWTQPVNQNFRVRFEISETNNGAANNVNYTIYYSTDDTNYTECTTSTAVKLVASGNVTDGTAITTANDHFGNLDVNGEFDSDGSVGNISLQNEQTEMEYCLQIDSASITGGTVYLRVYADDTPFTTFGTGAGAYTNRPAITPVIGASGNVTAPAVTASGNTVWNYLVGTATTVITEQTDATIDVSGIDIQEDDFILVYTTTFDNPGGIPSDDTPGFPFLRAPDPFGFFYDGTSKGYVFHRRVAGPSEPSSYDFTNGAATKTQSYILAVFRGIDVDAPFDAIPGYEGSRNESTSNNGSIIAPAFTTQVANTLGICWGSLSASLASGSVSLIGDFSQGYTNIATAADPDASSAFLNTLDIQVFSTAGSKPQASNLYSFSQFDSWAGGQFSLRLLPKQDTTARTPPFRSASCRLAKVQASGSAKVVKQASGAPSIPAVTASGVANSYIAPKVWLNTTQTLSGATEMTVTSYNTAGTSITFTDPAGPPTGSNLWLGVENRNAGGGESNTGWIQVTVNQAGAKTASGTPSIPAVTASGTAEVIKTASGTPSIPAITASGTAERIITASGTPSIAAVTASGAAPKEFGDLRQEGDCLFGAAVEGLNISLPNTCEAESLIVIAFGYEGAATTATVTGFSESNEATIPDIKSKVFYKVASGGEQNFSVGLGGSRNAWACVYEIKGPFDASPLDTQSTQSGVSTTWNTGTTGTQSTTGNFAFASLNGDDNAVSFGALSNSFVTRRAVPFAQAFGQGASWIHGFKKLGASTAAQSTSVTITGSAQDYAANLVTFKQKLKTASGTPSIPAITASGVAEVIKTAVGAATIAAITATGATDIIKTASGTPSIAPIEASGTAERIITASGTPSIAAVTASGTAEYTRKASGTPSISAITVSGVAERILTASGTPDIPAVTASGNATVGAAKSASGNPLIPAVTASGTAERIITASGTPAIAVITADGTVEVIKTASGTPSIPAVTASGTAEVIKTASGTPSIPAVTASGTAEVINTATGAATLAAITASGTAEYTRKASGTPSIAAVTASGTAEYTRKASGTPSIAAITASGLANLEGQVNSSGNPSIAAITASGSAEVIKTASGTPSIPAITAAGVAERIITASGTPSIPAITAAGVAERIITASGTPLIPAITAAGVAERIITASGTPSIPVITATGTAERIITASGTPSIPVITASGVAEVINTASGTPSIPVIAATGTAERIITASGTPSIVAVTASGVATIEGVINSTGSPSLAAVTASGTAEVIRIASGTPSIPAITASATAEYTRKASGTPSIPAVTASGTAVAAGVFVASGTPSIAAITATGTAERIITASGTPSIPAIAASGTAVVESIKFASGTPSIPKIEADGVAEGILTASGAATIPGVEASGIAEVVNTASGAATLGAVTASGIAEVSNTASGAVSVPAISASGTAILIVGQASGDVTIPAVTASGTATILKTNSGTPSIPAVTASGVAEIFNTASGAVTIPAATASGTATATATLTASGTPSIAAVEAFGLATLNNVRNSAGRPDIPAITASGAVTVTKKASGTPSIAAATASGVGEVIGVATGAATVPAIVASGNAEVIKTASGTPSIPAIEASGNATQTIFAYNNTPKIRKIRAKGTAVLAKFASGTVTIGAVRASGTGPGVTTKRAVGMAKVPAVIARGFGPNVVWTRMSVLPWENETSYVPYVETTSIAPFKDVDTEHRLATESFENPPVPDETDTAPRPVTRPTVTLVALGSVTLGSVEASGGAVFPNPASGSVILTPFTSSGIATIPPVASGSASIPIITSSGTATAEAPATGEVRNVTVAEINATAGMYGLYDATGSIDNHLVPATGGNAYIRRAYTRSGLGSWRYRFDQSLGGDPGATITVDTFSFIKVTTSDGVMTLDHRLTSQGGDITSESGGGTNGFFYFNAPLFWDADDIGLVYSVEFIV